MALVMDDNVEGDIFYDDVLRMKRILVQRRRKPSLPGSLPRRRLRSLSRLPSLLLDWKSSLLLELLVRAVLSKNHYWHLRLRLVTTDPTKYGEV